MLTETVERMRASDVLMAKLASVAEQREEMLQDDIGHEDIEAWVEKWQLRRKKVLFPLCQT